MPKWIHDRALRILEKSPDIDIGVAHAVATQQAHALGKSPKTYGTDKGREDAKAKYQNPAAMRKTAFMEALPTLTGLATGYGPGQTLAETAAEKAAPDEHDDRAKRLAKGIAMAAVPLGGIAAMGLVRRTGLAPRLGKMVSKHFPAGIIAEPAVEQELVHLGIPSASAVGGSLLGGVAAGSLAGGIQRLRKDDEPMKMGQVMRHLMKAVTPIGEKEDAEFGDELEPDLGKTAFSTNAYSGVMNPPTLNYASGIPPWAEPPVKTAGPPSEKGKEKKARVHTDSDDISMDEVYASPEEKARDRTQRLTLAGITLGGSLGWLGKDIANTHRHAKEHGTTFGHAFHRAPSTGWRPTAVGAGVGALAGYGLSQLLPKPQARPSQKPLSNDDPDLKELMALEREEELQRGKVAMFNPTKQLSQSKAVGQLKFTPPPGPSIAQVSKPQGYGKVMSGAAKGNNII